MNVSEPINDEKCPQIQKWTEKSPTAFKAGKHKADLKEEMKAFVICILCCCTLRLIGWHARGILVLLCVLVLSIRKNDLIVPFFFHVII